VLAKGEKRDTATHNPGKNVIVTLIGAGSGEGGLGKEGNL